MLVIEARNVQEAVCHGAYFLEQSGVRSPSRYGDVIVYPTPVTTLYRNPTERVIFHAQRDAHPIFHLMESLWMLSGRNDVEFPAYFVKRMASFSDDGVSFHAAYGHRWRNRWAFDQLGEAAALLRNKPLSRRAVVCMWNPQDDLHTHEEIKDIPCNLIATFQKNAATDALDMTVFCRSNDMVWGAYGANAVHLSVLHEYLAGIARMNVGVYYQISNNFHAYDNTFDKVRDLSKFPINGWMNYVCPYERHQVQPYPMVHDPVLWDADLGYFMLDPTAPREYANPFFHEVARPLYMAHSDYKDKSNPERFAYAREWVKDCKATDWQLATNEWLDRREMEAIRGPGHQ